MTLVSWAKKELARFKFRSPKRLLPPPTTLKPSTEVTESSRIPEVTVVAADLRCIKCQDRVAALLSTIGDDFESIVFHAAEKKVILTRKGTSG